MEFPCSAIVTLLLVLSVGSVSCSNLDQELRAALTVSQLALSEQSSALAQILQQNQLSSQGLSQSLVQMAQDFKDAMTQMTNLHSASLSQLTQELSRQHSSSLSQVSQAQGCQQSSSQSQMLQEIRQLFITSQSQLSGAVNESFSKLSESLKESMTDAIQELSQSRLQMANEVPRGFHNVSDGWYRIVHFKKSWTSARLHCLDLGGDLATLPTDFDAFQKYVVDIIGVESAWLGGRRVAPNSWEYLDGHPVDRHWYRAAGDTEPDAGDDCLVIDGNYFPLCGRKCTETYFFVCRYG